MGKRLKPRPMFHLTHKRTRWVLYALASFTLFIILIGFGHLSDGLISQPASALDRPISDEQKHFCDSSVSSQPVIRLSAKFGIVLWNTTLFDWIMVHDQNLLSITEQNLLLHQLYKEGIQIKLGGVYNPPYLNYGRCDANMRVAVFVPFRNRGQNLAVFLAYMHRFLPLHRHAYQIFVLEQTNHTSFNRAKLFNAGLKEIGVHKQLHYSDPYYFDCFVLHDVDKVPANIQLDYACPPVAQQLVRWVLSVEARQTHRSLKRFYQTGFTEYYYKYLGGATIFARQTLLKINGASNSFYGWGGEDDDLALRLKMSNLEHTRVSKPAGLFYNLDHQADSAQNPMAVKMLDTKQAIKRLLHDGLNQVHYKMLAVDKYPLFTHYKFQL